MINNRSIYIVIETNGIGGAEKRFTDLWVFFVQKKIDIHLVIENYAYVELLKNENYKFFLLTYCKYVHVLNLYGSNYASFFFNLHRFFWKQPKKAIVHFPLTYVFGLNILYGHKIVSSYVAVFDFFKSNSFRFLINDFFRLSGFLFSNAIDILDPEIFEGLKNRYIIKDKISLTAGGTHVFLDAYKRLPKKLYFTFLGSLYSEKQALKLICVLPKVNDELISKGYTDYKFIICGKGDDQHAILNLLSTKVYSQIPIELCYTTSPEKILGESAIFFSLQRTTNYPSKSLAEAIVCGCYPIVTDVGSTDLMLSNIPYFTKVPVDFESIHILKAIIEYLELSTDSIDNIAELISSKGRDRFRIESQANYFHEIYSSL
jgi:glycosyltransferase involved in cell wall biosynthesis